MFSRIVVFVQVLHLEQLLTTGGGWQDQVGGLIPGIKVGHSKAELPLQIDVKFINVSPETVQAFSDRLVLVYTGKTRLARNLLQVIQIFTFRAILSSSRDKMVANKEQLLHLSMPSIFHNLIIYLFFVIIIKCFSKNVSKGK